MKKLDDTTERAISNILSSNSSEASDKTSVKKQGRELDEKTISSVVNMLSKTQKTEHSVEEIVKWMRSNVRFDDVATVGELATKYNEAFELVDNNEAIEAAKQLSDDFGLIEAKSIEEGGVKDWLSAKINAALVDAGVPLDKWDGIEDTVFASALAGKLGDGTISDETSAAITNIVANLIEPSVEPLAGVEPEGEAPEEPETEIIKGDEIGIDDLDLEVPLEVPGDVFPLAKAPEEFEEPEEEEEPEEGNNKFSCECLECGHTFESDGHCREIECPECGGETRRVERPGPGWREGFVGIKSLKAINKPILSNLLRTGNIEEAIDKMVEINRRNKC